VIERGTHVPIFDVREACARDHSARVKGREGLRTRECVCPLESLKKASPTRVLGLSFYRPREGHEVHEKG
jgi:hypothetical protein